MNWFVAVLLLFIGVASGNVIEKSTDPCADKWDGFHETKDLFQYMVCTNKRVTAYVSCGDKVFDPCSKTCVSSDKISMETMCKCRSNGNVMDPWNCHKYVTCSNGYHYLFNCSRSGLVYDPKVDRCVQPGKRECKEIHSKDACAKKEDGRYGTSDVFQYMVCKHRRAQYVSCGDNVYDPCERKCVAPSKISMETMCKCRSNGNVMDPWNCHKYVTCSNGYHYLFNCSRSGLVYDPKVDRCVQPGVRECKEAKVFVTLPEEPAPIEEHHEQGIMEILESIFPWYTATNSAKKMERGGN